MQSQALLQVRQFFLLAALFLSRLVLIRVWCSSSSFNLGGCVAQRILVMEGFPVVQRRDYTVIQSAL